MAHEEHLSKAPLTFFASPLRPEESHGNLSHSASLAASVPKSDVEKGDRSGSVPSPRLREMPAFQRHAEASNHELFFDLFFVANLTTFTSIKEINDPESLQAYIGFFAVLWITWYCVTLFDLRFSTDSVFERVSKALHFGVMVGFAVVGPTWHADADYSLKSYRIMSFILMASRFVLALQYTMTLWFTRKKHKDTTLPLSLVILTYILTCILYGSFTAGFGDPHCSLAAISTGECHPEGAKLYVAWYIIGVAEIFITIGISSYWRVISFKGTHIMQRMSLLSLIILGEGIIVITKAISKVVKNSYKFDAALVGQIVSAILIIYFLYMVYFDRLHNEHFGTIRQQLWSTCHFLLHTALVLVLQGVSMLILWLVALQGLGGAEERFRSIQDKAMDGLYLDGSDLAGDIRAQVDDFVWKRVPEGIDTSSGLEYWNKTLIDIMQSYDLVKLNDSSISAIDALSNFFKKAETIAIQTPFDSLSISIPKEEEAEKTKNKLFNKYELLDKYEERFKLVFDYVYVSCGLALIMMATTQFLSLPRHDRHRTEYMRIAFKGVCGMVLCLVCLVHTNHISQKTYMESAWMLPTLCIILFFCVVVTHIRPWHQKQH